MNQKWTIIYICFCIYSNSNDIFYFILFFIIFIVCFVKIGEDISQEKSMS